MMENVPKPNQGRLLVATGFDDMTPDLRQTAQSMARAFDMAVRFVHVVEPQGEEPWLAELPGQYTIPAIAQQMEQRAIHQAESSLAEVVESWEGPGPVSSQVLTGQPAKAILAESVSWKANAIITGCNVGTHRFVPKGLSTSLGLLGEASVPVLAVKKGHAVDFQKVGFHILVADDLERGSEEAVRRAFELASGLENSKVKQIHVYGRLRDLLNDSWGDFLGHSGRESALTFDEIWDMEWSQRMDALRGRGQPHRDRANRAGAEIHTLSKAGDTAEEIQKAAKQYEADLVVYGRHRLLHTRPFLIGKVPFHAMLSHERAVCVVPPREEYEANRAFPGAKGTGN